VCVCVGGDLGDSSYSKKTFILLMQLLKLRSRQDADVQVQVCLRDRRLHLYRFA